MDAQWNLESMLGLQLLGQNTYKYPITDIFISPTETKSDDLDYLSQPLRGVEKEGHKWFFSR